MFSNFLHVIRVGVTWSSGGRAFSVCRIPRFKAFELALIAFLVQRSTLFNYIHSLTLIRKPRISAILNTATQWNIKSLKLFLIPQSLSIFIFNWLYCELKNVNLREWTTNVLIHILPITPNCSAGITSLFLLAKQLCQINYVSCLGVYISGFTYILRFL